MPPLVSPGRPAPRDRLTLGPQLERPRPGWRAGAPQLLLVLVVLLPLLHAGDAPTAQAALSAEASARRAPAPSAAARSDSWPAFVIGASYQGPAARAWRGDYWAWWADDLFDAALVDQDFARAASVGLNTLRVFVQRELLHDLREDDWTKLDAVLDLADRHDLRLILTLGDYDEPRVTRQAALAGAIARRYAGRATILAYDLRNEPTFWVIQSAMYPPGDQPPLLSRRLLDHYGEQAAWHFIAAFRDSEEGKRGPLAIPERFDDEETYLYHNHWILSYKLALEASEWAARHGRSDLEYFRQPEAARWQVLLEALDATYAAWLGPRIQAIREADPAAVITVGHHDPLIAALPANQQLDAVSYHRYVGTGPDGLLDQKRQLQALRELYPDKPILLGEFGHRVTEPGEEVAAIDETATWLQLLAEGYAGGLKWMLTDTRDGTDTMGMFRMDGSPRPIAHATAHLARLVGSATGGSARIPASLTLDRASDGTTCYRFARGDAQAVGGRCQARGSGQAVTVAGLPVEIVDGVRQVFVTRRADGSYLLGVTAPARLMLRLAAGAPVRWTLSFEDGSGGAAQPVVAGLTLLELEAGRAYRLAPR